MKIVQSVPSFVSVNAFDNYVRNVIGDTKIPQNIGEVCEVAIRNYSDKPINWMVLACFACAEALKNPDLTEGLFGLRQSSTLQELQAAIRLAERCDEWEQFPLPVMAAANVESVKSFYVQALEALSPGMRQGASEEQPQEVGLNGTQMQQVGELIEKFFAMKDKQTEERLDDFEKAFTIHRQNNYKQEKDQEEFRQSVVKSIGQLDNAWSNGWAKLNAVYLNDAKVIRVMVILYGILLGAAWAFILFLMLTRP